jgi:hypothetical protein
MTFMYVWVWCYISMTDVMYLLYAIILWLIIYSNMYRYKCVELFTLCFTAQCIYATTLINFHNYYYPWYTILLSSSLWNKQTNNLHLSSESNLILYDLLHFIRYDVEGMVYNRDAYHELINKSVGDYAYIYIYYLITASSHILTHHYNQIHYDSDHHHYSSILFLSLYILYH